MKFRVWCLNKNLDLYMHGIPSVSKHTAMQADIGQVFQVLNMGSDHLKALDITTLKKDTDIIMGMMKMFEGNEGRMVGGALKEDKTFEACFAQVRAYDIDKAFSVEVHYADEVKEMAGLESTLNAMSGARLSATDDFRRFENKLSHLKTTLEGRKARLDDQKRSAESGFVAMLYSTLQWKADASKELLSFMMDGKTTMVQAKNMWMAEAKGRI